MKDEIKLYYEKKKEMSSIRKVSLSFKMGIGFAVPLFLTALIGVAIFALSNGTQKKALLARDESMVFAGVAQQMKVDSIQVQQWLTSAAGQVSSASEELSAQAEQMNQVVAELQEMVGGTAGTGTTRRATTTSTARPTLTTSDHAFHQIAQKTDTAPVKVEAKASPEEVIPLNDSEDFNDFNS